MLYVLQVVLIMRNDRQTRGSEDPKNELIGNYLTCSGNHVINYTLVILFFSLAMKYEDNYLNYKPQEIRLAWVVNKTSSTVPI